MNKINLNDVRLDFSQRGSVAGQVAVIAGGASPGMGRATATLLASLGAKVAVLDIDDQLGSISVSRIQDAGGEGFFVHADMTSEDAVKSAMDQVADTYGKIDLLFNNTGVPSDPSKSMADFSLDEWESAMRLNLNSAFLGMKYAIPYMLDSGHGAIVNNASASGLRANLGGAPYGVAKAGIIHMTKVAALEYGGRGIRVNAVCPYSISRKEHSPERNESRDGTDRIPPTESDLAKWQRAQLPMLRSGKGYEVANAVAFLLSDAASWINGAALPVDGASVAGYFGKFR